MVIESSRSKRLALSLANEGLVVGRILLPDNVMTCADRLFLASKFRNAIEDVSDPGLCLPVSSDGEGHAIRSIFLGR